MKDHPYDFPIIKCRYLIITREEPLASRRKWHYLFVPSNGLPMKRTFEYIKRTWDGSIEETYNEQSSLERKGI